LCTSELYFGDLSFCHIKQKSYLGSYVGRNDIRIYEFDERYGTYGMSSGIYQIYIGEIFTMGL